MTAAFGIAVLDFVVGQNGAQCGAPIHPTLGTVGQAVILQQRLPGRTVLGVPFGCSEFQCYRLGGVQANRAVRGQVRNQGFNRFCSVRCAVVPAAKELRKNPLRPAVVIRFARAHLAAPIKAESNPVQLLPVARNVRFRGDRRMLPRLDGVLFRGQAKGVVSHGVQHVVSLVSFEPRHAVGRDVPQRMAHVQSGTGRIGEHVQHVVLGKRAIV